MSDRNLGGEPPGDEIDIQLTPVDDEYSASPQKTAPRRIEPRRIRPRSMAPSAVATDEAPARPEAAPPGVATHDAFGRSMLRLYFEAAVATLAFCLFVVGFLVQPVSVDSGSMLNTILVGDHLLVNRVIYGGPTWLGFLGHREIRRGDVIVFKHPEQPDALYVKRVVGLPGETIEIYGTRVYVDGKELPETKALVKETEPDDAVEIVGEPRVAAGATYTVYYSEMRSLGDDDAGFSSLVSADRGTVGVGRPFRIPAGHYFCLGDNRDNSADSRSWGTVPRENVVGRAAVVYWSTAPSRSGGWPDSIRWSRIGTLVQ
jgi:signal peptidase I